MSRMSVQRPFLVSLLREAKHRKRKALLHHANKEQINAVSELVMNLVKKRVPVSPKIVRTLLPYKNVLRTLSKRKQSVKARKQLLASQEGGAFWKGLDCSHRLCHR